MPDFYVSFGMRESRFTESGDPADQHPTFPPAHPDGYLRVTGAPDWIAAQRAAFKALGRRWAFCYPDRPEVHFAPRGELGTLDADTGKLAWDWREQ